MKTIDRQLENMRQLGGEEFVREMIGLFLQTMPPQFEAVCASASAGDWPALKRAIHSLKSAAGNMGAVEVQQTAARIEELAHTRNGQPIPLLLHRLEQEFAVVIAYLQGQRL